MTGDLNKLFLRYVSDPTAIDPMLEGVRRYAIKLADRNNHHSPEDAAQDIVVKTWKALSMFERRSTFESFVRTIALHHLYDETRASKRRIAMAAVERLPEQTTADPGCDRFSLQGFSDNDKVILCTLAKHMQFGKAAAELGITPKALRSRLERLKVERLRIKTHAA